ncbi:MAG: ATP-binding cassette domain-containing protein [Janthinobacterium lividum]
MNNAACSTTGGGKPRTLLVYHTTNERDDVPFFIAPNSPGSVLTVSHLTKRFGPLLVLDDLSFSVAAGETLVLLGPSGCGKTTLLKTLNRLIEPDGGTIELNGRDVRAQRPEELRRGIGYVIQQVGLLPHYTVAQNIGVVPSLLAWPAAKTAARTAALLERVQLPPARFGPMLPAQLSGGQQQRVGLARALAADPPLVLLDEPFGALDPLTRAAIRRDFRELDELRRKTVVLVTHDVAEAFELADRIMLLHQGRIQQLGTPRELLLQPANDFVRSFFQAGRLELLLQVLTLADVLPWLPPTSAAAAPPADNPALPLSTSLQAAVAFLSAPVPSEGNPLSKKGSQLPLESSQLSKKGSQLPSEGSQLSKKGSQVPLEGSQLSKKGSQVPSEGTGVAAETTCVWVAAAEGLPRPLTLPHLLAALGHLLQTPPRA